MPIPSSILADVSALSQDRQANYFCILTVVQLAFLSFLLPLGVKHSHHVILKEFTSSIM